MKPNNKSRFGLGFVKVIAALALALSIQMQTRSTFASQETRSLVVPGATDQAPQQNAQGTAEKPQSAPLITGDSSPATSQAGQSTPSQNQPNQQKPLAGKVIMIDPGHGGRMSGAVRNAVMEKDLTLSIAEKLQLKLEALGATVIATRTNDSDISLADRVALSNSVKPDIFVSIHINANRSSAIAGIETYYYSAESKELASLVYDSLTTDLKEPGNWVSYDELYVLHHNDRISILAEVGYLSHAATRKKLVRADYQERIAQALCDGIKTYFDEQAKHQGGVGQLPQGPRQAN